MTKEKILDYVTETPGNTNRNVLGSMLDSFQKNSEDINIQEPLTLAIINLINNYDILYTTNSSTFDPRLNGLVEENMVSNRVEAGLSIEPNGKPLTIDELQKYNNLILICDLNNSIVFSATSRKVTNIDSASGEIGIYFVRHQGTSLVLDSWNFDTTYPRPDYKYGCDFYWGFDS